MGQEPSGYARLELLRMNNRNVSLLEWLMVWYRSMCDGDWEHQNGIRISTIDNPGWSLDVDLSNTYLAGISMPPKMIERSDSDWLFVEIEDDTFRARGGIENLSEMMDTFVAFVESHSIHES